MGEKTYKFNDSRVEFDKLGFWESQNTDNGGFLTNNEGKILFATNLAIKISSEKTIFYVKYLWAKVNDIDIAYLTGFWSDIICFYPNSDYSIGYYPIDPSGNGYRIGEIVEKSHKNA